MKRLLDPNGNGLAALDQALAERTLLAFDFDGTLAPLVDHPDDARVAPELTPRLQRLTELATVAIISGRGLADLRQRLPFAPAHLIGNHGAEGEDIDQSPAAARLKQGDQALAALRARLAHSAAAVTANGVEVEDKGRSLALHYRRAPEPARALETISRLLVDHDPLLHVYGGKDVVNIVIAAAPDKGEALLALAHQGGFKYAVFAGDDVNDEAVFERARPGWVTIRVGLDAPDSKAGWRVASIDEMAAVLDHIITRLEAKPAAR